MKTMIRTLGIAVICLLTIQLPAQTADEFTSILKEYFEADGPGATAIVTKGDKVLYRGAVGKAHLELDVDMLPEHIFRIGSITKQFTAVAILKLQEEGKLAVSDPITKYLPDYPTQGHEITIEHLLTHTSGIQSYTDIPGWMNTETRKDRKLDELIDAFADHPMQFAPGEEWRYNNSAYVLLGAIVEKASGMSYPVYMQSQIFDPLDLISTSYDNHNRIIPNRIPGYQPGGPNGVENADFLSMTLPHAAGSLISNVDDLAAWNRKLHAGALISKSTLTSAFEPYILADGSPTAYGYGWGISKLGGKTTYEHGGGIHGFLTNAIYVVDEDVYVAVLSNCNCNEPDGASVRMAALAIGHSFEFTEVTVDPAELEEYVGVYDIEDSEDLRVFTVENGKLYSKRGNGQRFEITPTGKDQFYYPESFTTLEFVRDDNGDIIGQYVTPRSGVKVYAALTDEKPEIRKTVKLDHATLERYTGDFELMPGFILTISRNGDDLLGQATGQGSVALKASSETHFFVEEIGAELEFKVSADGHCNTLVLEQGGQTIEGKRVDN